MKPLRRLLSILLLTIFGLPFASPAFALGRSAGDGVRACCRRAGAHHCTEMAMSDDGMAARPASGPQWSSPSDKCPFAPQATVAVHHQIGSPSTSASIFAAIISHPCGLAQTQSKWRIARDRSRSKRGPPSVVLA